MIRLLKYKSIGLSNSFSDTSSESDCPLLEELNDPRGPYHIQGRIKLAIERWGSITAIPPDRFLAKLLSSRGYETTLFPAVMLRTR